MYSLPASQQGKLAGGCVDLGRVTNEGSKAHLSFDALGAFSFSKRYNTETIFIRKTIYKLNGHSSGHTKSKDWR